MALLLEERVYARCPHHMHQQRMVHRAYSVFTLHQRRMESTSHLQCPTLHQRRIGEYIAPGSFLRCTRAGLESTSRLQCPYAAPASDGEYIAPAVCSYAAPAPDGEYIVPAVTYAAPAPNGEYIAPAVTTSSGWALHGACSAFMLHQRRMESTSCLPTLHQRRIESTSRLQRLHAAPAPDWRVHRACSSLTLHQRRIDSASRLQCFYAAPAPNGEYIAPAVPLRCTSAGWAVHRACRAFT